MFPDLVTLEPAGDDEDVFGAAWPLVQEWRKLKDTHPSRGRGLDWLRVEERRFTVGWGYYYLVTVMDDYSRYSRLPLYTTRV